MQPVEIVVGMQWGDEGKGKVVDAIEADYYVRVNGGPNAGHTVGAFKVHQIPPGFHRPEARLVIGPGSVLDVRKLIHEVDFLQLDGSRLLVDERVHLITDEHRERDRGEFGSTRTGNGPVHSDKYARTGVRLGQDAEALAALTQRGISVTDTPRLLDLAYYRGKRIVLMVAHGTMLDISFGTYPYVTSSHCTAAGALVGSGLPPHTPIRVTGVLKPYTTRVAVGPMRGELAPFESEVIRNRGMEFGTTTGRPRRVGALDLGQLRYAAALNGVDRLVMTKVDVLVGLGNVPVIGAPWGEQRYSVLEAPGWGSLDDPALLSLVEDVEKACAARVVALGTGPGREDLRWLHGKVEAHAL